ncbi:MAG: hypothetical protein KAU07_02830 [Candidatus Andersenbacteria bacterium]|nr:hypothetical protein [Candidatus Andersenbacteria bacterium]
MNKISKSIIKVVIVFVVFLSFNDRIANAEVDISGQCITLAPAISGSLTPNDICIEAGYYGCTEIIAPGRIYSDPTCVPIIPTTGFAVVLNCNDNIGPGYAVSSAKFTTLKCRDTRKWGDSPLKPKNVPDDIDSGVLNFINWILGFISIIAVLMIIWGGVLYLTSAGDESKVENGKKTVTYAFIGLIVAGLAYGIVEVIVVKILK